LSITTEKRDRLTEEVHKLKKTIRYLKSIQKQFISDGSAYSRTQQIIESNSSDGISIGMAYRTAINLEREVEQLINEIHQLIEVIMLERSELL
jgi:translation initiation factor 2B subunit (eIF-2B alpha/beta/delta family)